MRTIIDAAPPWQLIVMHAQDHLYSLPLFLKKLFSLSRPEGLKPCSFKGYPEVVLPSLGYGND
jgi:hypothetical protein